MVYLVIFKKTIFRLTVHFIHIKSEIIMQSTNYKCVLQNNFSDASELAN